MDRIDNITGHYYPDEECFSAEFIPEDKYPEKYNHSLSSLHHLLPIEILLDFDRSGDIIGVEILGLKPRLNMYIPIQEDNGVNEGRES